MTLKKKLQKYRCKNIRLVLTDVDGVLTDGGRYYSSTGEVIKKFHVRDGMGVNILLRNKIKTIVITKEKSQIVKKWSKDMNVTTLLMGIKNKESQLLKICRKFHLQKNEIAYIGDDVNDLKLMKLVGFSATPKDGIQQAKKIANYICKNSSGDGAFRELVDVILSSKNPSQINWY